MDEEAYRIWATEIVDDILEGSFMPYFQTHYKHVVEQVTRKLMADIETVVGEGFCCDCDHYRRYNQ